MNDSFEKKVRAAAVAGWKDGDVLRIGTAAANLALFLEGKVVQQGA